MTKEIHELLQKMQEFTQTAVKKLQEGDKVTSAFYFSLASSISSQLSEKVSPK